MNELIVSDFTLTSNTTTITVTWTPSAAASYVSRYDVLWRVNGATTSFSTKSAGLATITNLDSGLFPGQAYDVKVVSVDTYSQVSDQTAESSVKSVRLSK